MEAIVLAGGLGTRLRPMVSDVPKPMAPVNGRPFLELLLEYWIGQGVRRFVLCVGYLAERIVGHFGTRWRGAEILYATENDPLGTGGALLLGLEKTASNNVLVVNGDTYFAVPLDELAELHASSKADWSLALLRSSDSRRYQGLTVTGEGRVTALLGETVNGGVYLMRAAKCRELPWQAGDRLSLESEILPHVLRSGWRLYGRVFERPFIDIGIPFDYLRAGEILQ